MMSELVAYARRPEDVSDELVATVATNLQIFGKSIKTMFNGLSLLKLFSEEPELSATVAENVNAELANGRDIFQSNPSSAVCLYS
jgi:hypothetical protein